MKDSATFESTDALLTTREVAEILRVNKATLRRWERDGDMPVRQVPGSGKRKKYRIRKSYIHTYIKQ